MLNAMRNSKKLLSVILWMVILAFVSTIFIVWGVGSKEDYGTYAVKIGDTEISFNEYRNSSEQFTNNLRAALGDNYNLYVDSIDLEAAILNDLIDRKLLHKEALRLNIPVSDAELIATISQVQSFQTNGVFDPNAYVQVLSYTGQTPAQFEEGLRIDLMIDKLIATISTSQSVVSDEEINLEYNHRNTAATVNYIEVPVTKFEDMVDSSEANLKAYYEANKENYRKPAQIRLKYFTVNKDEFAKSITISDEELNDYYNVNKEKFGTPTTAVIQTMDIFINDWTNDDEVAHARSDLTNNMQMLDATASNFASAAQQLHIKTSETGKERTVTVSQLVPEIAAEVAKLQPTQVSGIIKTPTGFSVVRLVSRTDGVTPPLEEIRSEVLDTMKNERLNTQYRAEVLDIYQAVLKAGNITAYNAANADNAVETITTELFAANTTTLPVLLDDISLVNYLFTLGVSELSQVAEFDGNSYLFEVVERVESSIPTYEDVASIVAEDYKNAELVTIGTDEVKKALEAGTLAAAASKYAVDVKTSESFKRTEPFGTFILNQALVTDIFKAKQGDTLKNGYIIGGDIIGVEVATVTAPDSAGLADEYDAIKAFIASVKAETAVKAYIDSLKEGLTITIDPSLVQE